MLHSFQSSRVWNEDLETKHHLVQRDEPVTFPVRTF